MEINHDQLIERIKDQLKEEIEGNTDVYFASDGGFINREEAEDTAINHVIDNYIADDYDLTEEEREEVFHQLHEKLGDDAEDIATEVKELMNESEAYNRNPLRYHGHDTNDFI